LSEIHNFGTIDSKIHSNLMKKTQLILLCSLLMSQIVFTQLTPEFQSTLYFEDAIGNKDTLLYGFDERAEVGVNPEFGEVDISSIPMDSVFEVRFIHPDDFNNNPNFPNPHYKKFIGQASSFFEPINCYNTIEGAMILVRCNNLPISIEWESEVYDSSFCTIGSSLMTQAIFETVNFWFEEEEFLEEYVCLSSNEYFSASFEIAEPVLDLWTYYSQENVEGIGIDSVYGIALGIGPGPSPSNPCDEVFILNTNEEKLDLGFQVYPNPTSGFVQFSEPANYQLYNMQGQLIQYGVDADEIFFQNAPSGMYILRLEVKEAIGYRKVFLE